MSNQTELFDNPEFIFVGRLTSKSRACLCHFKYCKDSCKICNQTLDQIGRESLNQTDLSKIRQKLIYMNWLNSAGSLNELLAIEHIIIILYCIYKERKRLGQIY